MKNQCFYIRLCKLKLYKYLKESETLISNLYEACICNLKTCKCIQGTNIKLYVTESTNKIFIL